MASRIEKTLAQREQERVNEPQGAPVIADPAREKQGSQYFSYLMLLLGVVVGAVIGAALYFIIPDTGLSGASGSRQLVALKGLGEADQLLQAGRFDAARKAYLAVITAHPESPRPYNNLAALYAAEGDFDQAQVLLNKALQTDRDYLTIYQNAGMVYAAMARDSYGKALQLKGKRQPLHLKVLGEPLPVVAQNSSVHPEPPDSASKKGKTVAAKPIAAKPVAVKPVAAKPVAAKPVAAKPVAAKAVAAKPVAAKPIAAKPIAAKPIAAKPIAAKPIAAKPVAAKPVAAKPVAAKPVAAKPVAAKAVAAKAVAAKAVAAKPVAAKPVAATISMPLVVHDSAISDPGASLSPQQFLYGWARDWSAQDVAGYLGRYTAGFKPVGSLSKKDWSEKRRKRLTSPKFIKVRLDALELVRQTDNVAEIQLIQSYRSDRFSDRTRKSFVLKRVGQSWLIAEERSLGLVR